MQYLSEDKKDAFYLWVDNSNLRNRKKKNLLKETLTDDDLSGFKKRNLQDTQYISRFLLNYLKKYLQLAPNSKDRKNTIVAVNGAATAYVRKRWGISKIRENGDVHHAVDAVVIACITQAMIKRISEYSKYHENEHIDNNGEYFDIDKRTGEMINRFPMHSITAINHDNTYKLRSLGVKSLLSIEKCQVDVLGNITKAGREKRMGFR